MVLVGRGGTVLTYHSQCTPKPSTIAPLLEVSSDAITRPIQPCAHTAVTPIKVKYLGTPNYVVADRLHADPKATALPNRWRQLRRLPQEWRTSDTDA